MDRVSEDRLRQTGRTTRQLQRCPEETLVTYVVSSMGQFTYIMDLWTKLLGRPQRWLDLATADAMARAHWPDGRWVVFDHHVVMTGDVVSRWLAHMNRWYPRAVVIKAQGTELGVALSYELDPSVEVPWASDVPAASYGYSPPTLDPAKLGADYSFIQPARRAGKSWALKQFTKHDDPKYFTREHGFKPTPSEIDPRIMVDEWHSVEWLKRSMEESLMAAIMRPTDPLAMTGIMNQSPPAIRPALQSLIDGCQDRWLILCRDQDEVHEAERYLEGKSKTVLCQTRAIFKHDGQWFRGKRLKGLVKRLTDDELTEQELLHWRRWMSYYNMKEH